MQSGELLRRIYFSGFFVEFPVHRLLGIFAAQHAALRELPSLAPDTAGDHQLSTMVREDDPDIRTESLIVDPVANHRNRIKLINCL